MNSYTVRKPCNHGLHLFLTIITTGLWGIFVWPFVAMYGRRETVWHQPMTQQPNAVNPYNGSSYYDPSRPPLTYPPGHPVQYGRHPVGSPEIPSIPWHGAR